MVDRYMVHGTWYMVHGTWYMVHGTWYMDNGTPLHRITRMMIPETPIRRDTGTPGHRDAGTPGPKRVRKA
jgi:hypothetical protein